MYVCNICQLSNHVTPSFPFPMESSPTESVPTTAAEPNTTISTTHRKPPSKIDISYTHQQKIKFQNLNSTFSKNPQQVHNKSSLVLAMPVPLAHIHLKPNVKLYTHHTPICRLHHLKQDTKLVSSVM